MRGVGGAVSTTILFLGSWAYFLSMVKAAAVASDIHGPWTIGRFRTILLSSIDAPWGRQWIYFSRFLNNAFDTDLNDDFGGYFNNDFNHDFKNDWYKDFHDNLDNDFNNNFNSILKMISILISTIISIMISIMISMMNWIMIPRMISNMIPQTALGCRGPGRDE